MDRRRTMTLSEQLSTPDQAIVRDILKLPHDDEDGDQPAAGPSFSDAISRGMMISWRSLRRRSASWTTTMPPPAGAANSGSQPRGGQEESGDKDGDTAAAVSLMALLDQADSQWDDDDQEEEEGAGARDDDDEDARADAGDEEDEEEEEEMVGACCCVCMVRHKGAAFIPCGHTFCRLCSRDLRLARATCPLCNAFIHDILHIF